MGKKLIIIAAAVFGVGLIMFFIALASANFDIDKLTSRSQTVTLYKDYEITSDTKLYIKSSVGDINIKKSIDDKVHITYTEKENDYTYIITNEGNVISIERQSFSKGWLKIFSFDFDGKEEVTVEIPSSFQSEIEVILTTGDIEIDNIANIKNINIDITTGETELNEVTTLDLSIKGTTGDVSLENVAVTNTCEVKLSTGKIEAENLEANKVSLESTTGKISFNNIIGNIITIHATTGKVEGVFKDSIANYTIISSTSTGRSNLPSTAGGGSKSLNVKTTTGNIDVRFDGSNK